MENRFGIKDLFLFLLLAVLIVVVVLAMKQYDRQWTVLREIQRQSTAQTRELSAIRQTIQSGGFAMNATTSRSTTAVAGQGGADPFIHVHEAQKNPDYALGDWYIDNFGTQIRKLTPLLAGDQYQAVVEARVVEGLLYVDPHTLEFVPLLAKSYDASPDGMKITFRLREGVTFSDGHPFSADDVVFTFDWIMNPAVAAPRQRSYLENIARVEKTGDYEVVFHFTRPYFNSVELAGTMAILAKHFYGKYPPEKYNEQLGMLMGTGPYTMRDPEAWRPGTRIELIRNERYWGEPGPFNRIIYNEVVEEVASLTMFRNGELDRFAAQPNEYVELLKDKPLVERTNHFEVMSPLSGYGYVAWNQQRNGKPTVFADKRVRQALTMLIDRERICKEIYLGYATVASGPYEPGSPQADPSIKPWPYDPAAAKKLLAQAGLVDRNKDGVLETADGAPLRFKLTYPTGHKLFDRTVFLIKDTLAAAGVAMEPEPVDWPILQTRLENREFDAMSLRWGGGSVEGDITQMFHSSQTKDNGDNYPSYINPELDKVIDQAKSTVDKSKRLPMWQECHRILHEDQPYTFLTNQKGLSFYDKRIQNIKPSQLGLNLVHFYVMPIPWYVPGPMQKYKD
jgi:peptide/nickel transport system substrate-binding protein